MLIEKKKSGSGGEGKEDDRAAAPTLPDGGWGWMVVFGSFMIHLIADGMAYSFGVYVESFIEEFEATRSEVGFLGSLMLGVTWGSGPIASMLTNKYGCRLVAMLGTVIAAFGFIISLFAPNIYFMYFSFGIVAGLGLGFAYLPAIVAVSFYFEKKRSLATGLAVCGSGFGTFIFAPLTQILLDQYSWKGTVLIESALLLNCIACGAVFRPVETPRVKSLPLAEQIEGPTDQKVEEEAACNGAAPSSPTNHVGSTSSLPLKMSSPEAVETTRLSSRPTSSSERHLAASVETKNTSYGAVEATAVVGQMDRKDVFYTQSLQNIPLYKSDPDLYKKSILPDPDSGAESAVKKTLCGGRLGKMMDCSLMSDACFVLFAISNMLTSIGFCVIYVFLPNRATVAGVSEKDAAFLIAIVGISNTVGRIVFGFLSDFKWVNRLMLYNTVLVLCGVLSLLSAVCYNYPLMASYAASFGLFIGVYICLTPIVLVDLLGLEKLSNAFGLVLLFQGIGTIVGPPAAGAIYDATEDYNDSFYFMGVCILVSGAMLYFIPCIQRCRRRDDDPKDIALGKSPTKANVEQTEEISRLA